MKDRFIRFGMRSKGRKIITAFLPLAKQLFTVMPKLIKSIKKLNKKIKDLFLELIFPQFCVGCHQEGSFLCAKCAGEIVPVVSQVCPKCGKLSECGEYHLNCKDKIALKGIIASAYFEEGPIREMIHNLKYNGVTELKDKLAELMTDALKQSSQFSVSNSQLVSSSQLKNENLMRTENYKIENLIITFTPLHWRRQATRGYNQSELLAREISRRLDIPVIDALKKDKQTNRQVELKGKARRENLVGVFRIKPKIDIKKKTIILVDDVYTTGSTLNECAKVLKTAGAKEVWGLVVARG